MRSETEWDNVTVSIYIRANSDEATEEPEHGLECLIAQIKHTLIGLGYSQKNIDEYFTE